MLEVLIVVTGIFLGLQADAWNEARKDRLKEQEYLARLHEDVERDIENFAGTIAVTESRRDRGLLLLDALDNPDLATQDTHQFFVSLQRAAYTFIPVINDNTYNEMRGAGEFTLIRDLELRNAIASYYAFIERFRQWDFLRQEFQLDYYRHASGILTPDQYQRLIPYDPEATFTVEETLEALARIRANPDFISVIYPSTNHEMTTRNFTEFHELGVALREKIGAAIGR